MTRFRNHPILKVLRRSAAFASAAALGSSADAQTAPTAQALPYSQDFGTASFSALPAGVAAWNGLNGNSISTATSAGNSAPAGDATVTARTSDTTTGGSFGYAVSGNARFYIQTSSNATNGANQLAIAVDTVGKINIVLSYRVESIVAELRTVGTVCQYRIGNSGPWTDVVPSSGANPVCQSGGSAGPMTTVTATLPTSVENQPDVQIRWATFRGSESGSSSGLAIDDISVTGTTVSNSLAIAASPDSFGEAAGANASTVTVSSVDPVAADTSVTLVSGDTGEAIVASANPAVIPAGETSVTFRIDAVDDDEFDGNQTVSLQATAVGIGTTSTNITIADDEDAYSPPSGYYAPATGLAGANLKAALHGIIQNGHTQFAYSNTLSALRTIYEDPSNTSNVLLVYSGSSVSKSATYYTGQDPGTTYSREHTWPDSFGLDPTNVDPGYTGGDAGPDFTDLFNLRPILQTLNSQRGNKYYDETTGSGTVPALAPDCSYDSDSFEPADSEKGDLARAMFYMATRYDGGEPLTIDLEIGNTPDASAGRFANLSTLLQWAEQDPVSEEERRRNQVTFGLQHNRNPFIDHPEYLALIWGSLRIDKSSVAVAEGGATDSYHLTLSSQPDTDVTVEISSIPSGQLAVSPQTVTFTPANWHQPVEVVVSAVDDTVFELSVEPVTIRHTLSTADPYYSTLAPSDLAAAVADNDPEIAPAPLPLAYGGPWGDLPAQGFLSSGTGTYGTSLGGDSGNGSIKFDHSGDKLTVSFAAMPGTLSYHLKGNPGGGILTDGSFQIFESPDNVDFTEVRSFVNKNNEDEAFADTLLPSTRF
ncbi:MAG: endonuclease, partial [Verrucomicrobiae bacterium]|nr:endonuclease [Verrucomicrobiae bacterium]